ncbi:hypothetical protein CEUSTIGMA_g7684.t1 [Chlamydomonas eustigma]|uniref:YchJ-like middle NTF2-like domain-containing protein n=1 Tax=Chlamydomonas eustigma TaxID=1157962 RepID=A0A250XB11_9CHLO|nr:hypothetical protein CEUSTIGMA_g7684.t1 [Chlamydomonas eustigma]|eukprot:GAX80246.1 hypothetical protein CEUSTIGMA_g7684.t1 [Chlamydomonas eustigma]
MNTSPHRHINAFKSGGQSFLSLNARERLHAAKQIQTRIRVQPLRAFKGFGKSDPTKNRCPCDSQADYSDCCQKLHKVQQLRSDSPEQLLRARFSAYVKKDWKYIVLTTHSKNEARRGSTAEGGKINSTFEQDVKVSMSWGDYSKLEVSKVEHLKDAAVDSTKEEGPAGSRREGAQAAVEFQYKMKQLFELKTGQKIKDPPCQDMTERAVFEVEEGDWKLLESHSNWDRSALQPHATADSVQPSLSPP